MWGAVGAIGVVALVLLILLVGWIGGYDKTNGGEIDRRRALVAEQRGRLLDELHDLPVDAPDSQANFVWLRAAELTGAQLAAGMEEAKVLVAPGAPLGADDHVRASIRGRAATDRLLRALREATGAV